MVRPGEPAWDLFVEEIARFLSWSEQGVAQRSSA
jgi:hypothetical protein